MVNNRPVIVDNRFVVPYNAFLLDKYDCHINVEICSTGTKFYPFVTNNN
jgi:hypothetical protein